MTRSFAVDQHNDLIIGSNRKLALVDNLQAVMAICTHAAQAILGEMIYAKKQGLPDFQTVWQGSANLTAWEVAYRARLKQIPEVTSLQSLSTWRDGDTMKYAAVIKTIYGTGEIHG